ncbi:MAG: hypothetical protein H6Q58_1514 [Firmicutes bacterium]|nr:hypothetical protein [Bacillota bacterium]
MVVAGVMGATLLGAGAKVYASPAYIVSLDVNPGVELEVNVFDRVIGVETNEDAAAALEGINLENMDIGEAISETVASIAEAGYLDGEGGQIYIAASSENDEAAAEDLAEELEAAAEGALEENDVEAEVTAQGIGYQMVQASRELDYYITPGKYNIITRVMGEGAVNEELAGMTVKDLMAVIKETRKGAKTPEETAVDEQAADVTEETVEGTQPTVKAEAKAEKAVQKSESKAVKAGSDGKSKVDAAKKDAQE